MPTYAEWFEAARADNVYFLKQHVNSFFGTRNYKNLNFTALLTAAHFSNLQAFSLLLPYELGLCTQTPFSLAALTSRGFTPVKIHYNTCIAQYCIYRNFYAGADLSLQFMRHEQFKVLRGSTDAAGKSTLTSLLEIGMPECTALLKKHFSYFADHEIIDATLDPLQLSIVFGRASAIQLILNSFKYYQKYTHEKIVDLILRAMRIQPTVYGLFYNESFATADEIFKIKTLLERIISKGEIKRKKFIKNGHQLTTQEVLAELKADLLDARESKLFPADLAGPSSSAFIEFLKTGVTRESEDDDSYYGEEQE